VAQVVAFAFGLAASTFFPVILLGIFDKRANRQGAIAGMVAGLLFTSVYILGCRADKMLPATSEPWWGPWFFGVSPEGIGIIGCLVNFVVAIVISISRLTPPPPPEVQQFVDDVRLPDFRQVHTGRH
jgi:cation/acetate symporter